MIANLARNKRKKLKIKTVVNRIYLAFFETKPVSN
jgi:hypothetical protein